MNEDKKRVHFFCTARISRSSLSCDATYTFCELFGHPRKIEGEVRRGNDLFSVPATLLPALRDALTEAVEHYRRVEERLKPASAEARRVESHLLGAGTQTQILCRSSEDL